MADKKKYIEHAVISCPLLDALGLGATDVEFPVYCIAGVRCEYYDEKGCTHPSKKVVHENKE